MAGEADRPIRAMTTDPAGSRAPIHGSVTIDFRIARRTREQHDKISREISARSSFCSPWALRHQRQAVISPEFAGFVAVARSHRESCSQDRSRCWHGRIRNADTDDFASTSRSLRDFDVRVIPVCCRIRNWPGRNGMSLVRGSWLIVSPLLIVYVSPTFAMAERDELNRRIEFEVR
jgi:hypothetical protein